MPDGDACRPDGTLKDATEMDFPNSPSETNLPDLSKDDYFFLNLKRSLPSDDSDEENEEESMYESESDGNLKVKVKYISIVFAVPENLPKLWGPVQIESNSWFRWWGGKYRSSI